SAGTNTKASAVRTRLLPPAPPCRTTDLLPVHRPRPEHMRTKRPAQQLLGGAGGVEQLDEVDAGGDSHLVEHRDEVLGRDVAGRARGDGAAAELAEGALERGDAGLERGEHVREALAAGVVEVGGELDVGEALARGGEELADLGRVRHPGRVAEADLLAAGGGEALSDPEHALGRNLALVGAAERDRDHALAAQLLGAG